MNPTEEQIIVTLKSKWRSLTVWFNGVITFLFTLDWAAAQLQLPNLQQYVPPQVYHWVVIVVGLMNILIRVYKTKGPVQ